MEGERVLDRYFTNIVLEIVESEEAGWAKIKDKTSIWV
jgi:hypothetical protein